MRVASIAVLVIALSVGACATEEWMQAKNECDYQAMLQHPAKYERKMVTKSRRVEKPDGTYTCTTQKSKSKDVTTCKQQTHFVYEDYQVLEDVDINQSIRDRYAYDCTSKLCVKRYGNPDCESPQKKTP